MNCLDLCCPTEIQERCPTDSGDVAYHTEIIVNGELHIPEQKPECEKIINISRKICITKVVQVPVKLDNGCMAGCKVLVLGTVRLGFEYSANVPEQNVHFVHFDVPFQGLIMDNACHRPIPPKDCNLKKFDLHVCVEHLEAEQVSPRSFEKILVLLLWLQRKNCHHHKPCAPKHEIENAPSLLGDNYTCGPQLNGACEGEHGHLSDSTAMECEKAANCHEPNCTPASCRQVMTVSKQLANNETLTIPTQEPPVIRKPVELVSKQISINETLIIPPQKPDAECLIDSNINIDVCKAEVIKTPLTDHCHKHIMKVVISGKAEIIVKYVADVPNQQVHAAVFRLPFEALIEWPGGPPEFTPICVTATVEHFEVDMLDHRRVYLVLILRFDAAKK